MHHNADSVSQNKCQITRKSNKSLSKYTGSNDENSKTALPHIPLSNNTNPRK